jgi:hypothetical protein
MAKAPHDPASVIKSHEGVSCSVAASEEEPHAGMQDCPQMKLTALQHVAEPPICWNGFD